MAIYHCHVRRVCHADAYKDVNHSPSAVASAAYITGMRLYDASADVVRDYTENADGDRTHRVAHVAVELPEGAPEELRDVATLANAMECGGGRKDAQTGRTVEYSLPRECSREEQIEIGENIARGFTREGMCAIWAIHDDGDGNPHIHMLVSVRPLKQKQPTWDPARLEGVWGAKSKCAYLVRDGAGNEARMTAQELKRAVDKGADWAKVYTWQGYETPERVRLTMAEAEGRELTRCGKRPVSSHVNATDWETKEALVRWRKLIADEINAGLDRHSAANPDVPAIKHVSHLSNEARGIPTVPTVHVGTRSRMGRRDEYRERRLRLNARIREHNAAIVNLIRRSVRVIPELVRSWADQERSKNVAWSLAKRNVKWAKARRAAQARANAEQPRHMSFTKASDDPEVHAKDATRAASDLKLEEKKPKVEEKNLQQQKPAFSFAKGAKKATKTQSDAQQKSQQQHSDFSFEKGTAKAKKRAAEKKHQEAIKKIVTDRSTSLAEKNASLKAEDKRRFDEITSQRIVPHLAPDLIASQQQQQIPEPEPVYERPAMLDALQEPSDPVAPQQQAPEIKAQQEPIYESLDSLIGNLGQARISAFSEPPTLAASANPSRGPKPDPPDYDERDNSPRARLAWADYRKQLDAWERGETTNTTNFQDRQQRGPHL